MPDTQVIRRDFPTDLEVRGEEDRQIVGYASVFYDGTENTEFRLFPGLVERIMPGAFDSAMERPDDVRALFNHDRNKLLGRTSAGTLSLERDARGLRYTIDPPDTPTAGEVLELIGRRDLQGSSFSFLVKEQSWIEADDNTPTIREIRDVELWDVGPVTFPAYDSTTTGLRNCDLAEARAAMEQWQGSRRRSRLMKAKRDFLEVL